jgi:hypothetical protein
MYQNYKKYHIKLLFFVKNYICSNFELLKNQKYQEYEKDNYFGVAALGNGTHRFCGTT